MRMGTTWKAAATLSVVLLCGTNARAQQSGRKAAGKTASPGQLTRPTGGSRTIDIARARAKGGDCKGALAIFDEAEQKGSEVALYRDRGACHEKMGHVFPAIDDYRAYLVQRPDAPDAEDIRSRLSALEGQTAPVETGQTQGSEPRASGSGSIRVNGNGVRADGSTQAGQAEAASTEPVSFRSYDKAVQTKLDQDASDASPLRRGTGLILAPYVGLRSQVGSGSNSDLGYYFGASLRNALGSVGSVVLEVGYAGFGTSGAASSAGGIQTMLGLEARFGLDPNATNQVFILGGFGYERFKNTTNKIVTNVLFLPRARLGFRHVFGPSLGLELSADGGPFLAKPTNLPLGLSADSEFFFMIGGTVALSVAF
jgi:opacity protein-like surface antigen